MGKNPVDPPQVPLYHSVSTCSTMVTTSPALRLSSPGPSVETHEPTIATQPKKVDKLFAGLVGKFGFARKETDFGTMVGICYHSTTISLLLQAL